MTFSCSIWLLKCSVAASLGQLAATWTTLFILTAAPLQHHNWRAEAQCPWLWKALVNWPVITHVRDPFILPIMVCVHRERQYPFINSQTLIVLILKTVPWLWNSNALHTTAIHLSFDQCLPEKMTQFLSLLLVGMTTIPLKESIIGPGLRVEMCHYTQLV